MHPLAVILIVALVSLLGLLAAGAGTVYGIWKLASRVGASLLPDRSERDPEPPALPDLSHYPERLAALEDRLEQSLRAGESQSMHLAAKRRELAAKPDREELTRRYTEDLDLLESQSQANRRVLATVWKTRAILALRVHLAEAARARPDLDHLPQPADIPTEQLAEAARAYTLACREVRAFVRELDRARSGLHAAVPSPSVHAEVLPAHREEVDREAAGIQRIFQDLRDRMDRLADTLSYLADRLRTQQVVEGSSGALDLGPEAGQILRDVSVALRALDELSAVGEAGLADAAVHGLASEIADLERLGLDVDLQADADREVERLLASIRT